MDFRLTGFVLMSTLLTLSLSQLFLQLDNGDSIYS